MKRVSFIGAGSMAEAVIAGIVNQKVLDGEQIFVINKENKERITELKELYGVQGCTACDERKVVVKQSDVIVIATKPVDVKNALQEFAEYIHENQLIISVVAGISTDTIVESVGKNVPVIRTMPNTSATIGYSATAMCKGKYATDNHIEQAKQLFEAIGMVSIVEEDKMHIVTAISGSGPAYVYYLVEAMEKAAKEEGLDEQIAKQLITQTIIGAGNMLQQRTESPEVLRENVTSPNGTTAAGIKTLEQFSFKEAVIECVKSATRRSEELGKEN